ncbi:MAG: c-type cytochrome [Polyangiaceae bacterium]
MAQARWLRFVALPLPLALAAFALVACERPPSADSLQAWTPADHDRAEEQSSQATRPTAPPPKGGRSEGSQGSQGGPQKANPNASAQQLVEITWEQACFPCHGPVGHGDGPNGPMVNAPDITRDDVLSKITDDEIAAQIKNGKNRMPKFDLPEAVVRGLVARIRANRGR